MNHSVGGGGFLKYTSAHKSTISSICMQANDSGSVSPWDKFLIALFVCYRAVHSLCVCLTPDLHP